jgi:hypothetical protein
VLGAAVAALGSPLTQARGSGRSLRAAAPAACLNALGLLSWRVNCEMVCQFFLKFAGSRSEPAIRVERARILLAYRESLSFFCGTWDLADRRGALRTPQRWRIPV